MNNSLIKNIVLIIAIYLFCTNIIAQNKCIEGNCVNGFGKLIINKDQHFYKGNFKDSLYHGNGMLEKFGVTYNGHFKEGLMHGKGTMYITISGSQTIVGNWVNDELDGMASEYKTPLIPLNGFPSFNCNYKNGKKIGIAKTYNKAGTLIEEATYKYGYKNGSAKKYNEKGNLIWEGFYHNNLEHGLIKEYDDNGQLISSKLYRRGWSIDNKEKYFEIGCVKGDCMNGNSKLIITNTENELEYYYGEFKNGKYHGNGEHFKLLVAEREEVYRGYFKNGKYHGKGSFSNAYGYRYDGDWENGKRNGYGIAQLTNNYIYRGFWKDDLKHGEGTYSDKYLAKPQKGTWKNNEFQDQKK